MSNNGAAIEGDGLPQPPAPRAAPEARTVALGSQVHLKKKFISFKAFFGNMQDLVFFFKKKKTKQNSDVTSCSRGAVKSSSHVAMETSMLQPLILALGSHGRESGG